MTDQRNPDDVANGPDDLPVGNVDASGEPSDVAELIHPEQPPMDDAAGPQEQTIEETDTDDLSVQGGE